MKEKDFGIESSTDKREARLRGLRKFAAAGSIAVAAFGLGACGDNASAESGEQSGQSGISAEASPSATESIAPSVEPSETASAEPSESESSEVDNSWVSAEFLQKISIDYDSFNGWDSMETADRLDVCSALFRNNGIRTLTLKDQSLDPTVAAMTGQEIVDYWNQENAVVYSIVNDRSDERNGDIAMKLNECITSDQLSSSEYSAREALSYAIQADLNDDAAMAPLFVFGKVSEESPRIVMASVTDDTTGGWNEFFVEGDVSLPGPFGDGETQKQAVFEMGWSGIGPIWRLAAVKDMAHNDTSDLSKDASRNLEPVVE